MANRDRVHRALVALEVPTARVDRFRGCGSGARVLESDDNPGVYRIRACYCGDRFCAPCSAARGNKLAGRLRKWLADQPARFVTLTMRGDGKPLGERLDRLYAAFRRLRRSGWWSGRVTGGAATLEVKWSVAGQHWHPHLHILCRGAYLDVRELSLHWHQATGDSHIVNVQLVKPTQDITNYVTKYMLKPGSDTTYRDPDRLQEMIAALHGRRLLLPFGDCSLTEEGVDEDTTTWSPIGRLADIINDALRGVPEAQAILNVLKVLNPCNKTTTERAPPTTTKTA